MHGEALQAAASQQLVWFGDHTYNSCTAAAAAAAEVLCSVVCE
jgi:hypothetical protein